MEAITERTLVIDIDVESETYSVRAYEHGGKYSKKPFTFSNSEAGFIAFKAWVIDITETHEKEMFVSGMEPAWHHRFNFGKFLQDNNMKC